MVESSIKSAQGKKTNSIDTLAVHDSLQLEKMDITDQDHLHPY